MAAKISQYTLTLDAEASRNADAVLALAQTHGTRTSIEDIASNAIRLAYGDKVTAIVRDAKPRQSDNVGGAGKLFTADE